MSGVASSSGLRLATCALALASCVACSSEEEPGRMVLSLYSDMAVPKDVDKLYVEVHADGELRGTRESQIGEGHLLLPATLTLVGNDEPATTAEVRVLAARNGIPQTLRRVVTQVPPARLSLLRVPIQWLCEGSAQGSIDVPVSKCPEGQSCFAGECVDDTDQSVSDYGTGEVFGGGDGQDPTSGTCFDTVTCLDQGFDVSVQKSDCSIARPSGDEAQLNVGLVTEFGASGICGRKDCYVPLDKHELYGWSLQGQRIRLPSEVCKRLEDGSVRAVRLANGPCASKLVQIPPCGPWSAVGDFTPQQSKECEALCVEIAKSSCTEETPARCFSRCYPAAGVCDGAITDYAKCGKNFAFKKCSPSEPRTEPAPECALQAERFQVCRECARQAQGECDYCTCGKCETEVKNCDASAACSAILQCAKNAGCHGSACDVPCQAELAVSATAAQLFADIGGCQAASCSGSCTGK